MSFLWFLIIGALAGWLAGKITRGAGFGVLANLLIGIVGAVLGGLLFRLVGMTSIGLIGELFTATVGAIVFLFILGKVKSAP
ncbi:MAG: GlsB/YeaQ/YmgE family stress response membrane protein [Planctomycetaceae bacterium]|nr:GlsB/YeaQ/YmgE family stress response membrane protein [Planctomycetaceae bacterium]